MLAENIHSTSSHACYNAWKMAAEKRGSHPALTDSEARSDSSGVVNWEASSATPEAVVSKLLTNKAGILISLACVSQLVQNLVREEGPSY